MNNLSKLALPLKISDKFYFGGFRRSPLLYPIQECSNPIATGFYLVVDDIDSFPPSIVPISYSGVTCPINVRDVYGYNTAWDITVDDSYDVLATQIPFANQNPTRFLFNTTQTMVWILMIDGSGDIGISLFGTTEFFYEISLLPDLILLDFVVNSGNTIWISYPARLGLLSILLHRMSKIWRTDLIQLKAMFNLKLQEFPEFYHFCSSVGVSAQ